MQQYGEQIEQGPPIKKKSAFWQSWSYIAHHSVPEGQLLVLHNSGWGRSCFDGEVFHQSFDGQDVEIRQHMVYINRHVLNQLYLRVVGSTCYIKTVLVLKLTFQLHTRKNEVCLSPHEATIGTKVP